MVGLMSEEFWHEVLNMHLTSHTLTLSTSLWDELTKSLAAHSGVVLGPWAYLENQTCDSGSTRRL